MNAHNQNQQRNTFEILVAIVVIALVIAGIVLAALSIDALWSLIGGVFVVGAILIGLAWIGVNLYSRWTDATLKRDELRFSHIETVMKLGYLPTGRNVRYEPIPQLEAPEDVAVSLRGVTPEQLAEYKIHAVNLLALSKQELGANSGQVIPFYKAKKNDYFKDVEIWSNAVRYLIANSIATERYKQGENGKRKEGTYLIAGTVGQAFDAMNQP